LKEFLEGFARDNPKAFTASESKKKRDKKSGKVEKKPYAMV
jgi:hypothetical protein